jgi:hypothetical protein
MKNRRMLSIGKRIFSPSLEQTPKARSSKNNFNFSMVGAKWTSVKVLKNSGISQTTLIIRLFCLASVFFFDQPFSRWAATGNRKAVEVSGKRGASSN